MLLSPSLASAQPAEADPPEGIIGFVATFSADPDLCPVMGGGLQISAPVYTAGDHFGLTLNFDIKGTYCDTEGVMGRAVHNLVFPLATGLGARIKFGFFNFELRAAFAAKLGLFWTTTDEMGYEVPTGGTTSEFLPMLGAEFALDVGPLAFLAGLHWYIGEGENQDITFDVGIGF